MALRTKNVSIPGINIRGVNLQWTSESIAGVERNVKVAGTANSKIPSIFDHKVRNSSTIKSNYHMEHSCTAFGMELVCLVIRHG